MELKYVVIQIVVEMQKKPQLLYVLNKTYLVSKDFHYETQYLQISCRSMEDAGGNNLS